MDGIDRTRGVSFPFTLEIPMLSSSGPSTSSDSALAEEDSLPFVQFTARNTGPGGEARSSELVNEGLFGGGSVTID